MLDYRKVPANESSKLFPPRGHVDLSDFTEMLSDTGDGDVVEVQLGTLSSRSMKRRIGMAARILNRSIKFTNKANSNHSLFFRVQATKAKNTKKVKHKTPVNSF